jgi:hypothetical protein
MSTALYQQNPKTKSGKRRQVRQACINCRKSHTACQDERPCKRCVAHGLGHLCVDVHTAKAVPTKRLISEVEKLQLPSKKHNHQHYEHNHHNIAPLDTFPISFQPIAPKKQYGSLFTEELYPTMDFFSNIELKETNYEIDDFLNFDFEPNQETPMFETSDPFFNEFNPLQPVPQAEVVELSKDSLKMLENENSAIWSLDGTILSASDKFMKLFKIPEQLLSFSTVGPHFSTIISSEESKKSFTSLLKNKISEFNGTLELTEFNTEFEFNSFFSQSFQCHVRLNLVFGSNSKPKYLTSQFTPV